MARINIEECWWSDPRRTKLLLKIGFAADSAAVNMWRTAQEFWGKERGLVPQKVFDELEFSKELIGVGLAEVRQDGVYVSGSSAYLDWHYEKKQKAKDAGKKGGQQSAKRPRDEKGRLCPSKTQAKSKQSQANPSPPTPTPTPLILLQQQSSR